MGLTHVVNSPGPFEINTTVRPGSEVVIVDIEFKVLTYADGETWTRKAEATRSLDVRVYQFHHIRSWNKVVN